MPLLDIENGAKKVWPSILMFGGLKQSTFYACCVDRKTINCGPKSDIRMSQRGAHLTGCEPQGEKKLGCGSSARNELRTFPREVREKCLSLSFRKGTRNPPKDLKMKMFRK